LAAAGLVGLPTATRAEEQPSPLWTPLSSTTISGYVNTSMHWNPGTGNANPPGFFLNEGKQDGFNLDVVQLNLEKPLGEETWTAGYRVELIFGPDAAAWATSLDGAGDAQSTAVKQAYVTLRAPLGNGLDFQVGVFDSPIGYEYFEATLNANYTSSYGNTIEPAGHTGVLVSYEFCPAFKASAGVANTFGPAINERANPPKAESYKTYIGYLEVNAPEDWGWIGGSSVFGGVVNGFSTDVGATQTAWFLGVMLNTPIKNLKVGAAFDYLGSTAEFGADSFYANAWALYASFQATEKLSFHARAEYASTDTGLLSGGFTDVGPAGINGNAEVFALTGTIQYDLWANVLSRLEVRWDHQAGDGEMNGYGGSLVSSGGTGGPPPGGDLRNAVMIAANIIYKF
jgi:hypothetical protein